VRTGAPGVNAHGASCSPWRWASLPGEAWTCGDRRLHRCRWRPRAALLQLTFYNYFSTTQELLDAVTARQQCQRQPDIPAAQDHQHLASARVALRSADRRAVALDLHGVLQALLAACVSAIAGRPLHRRLATRLPRHMRRSTKALIFTLLVTVMAPLMFASGTLLTEASALLAQIAATARRGLRLRSGWSALQ